MVLSHFTTYIASFLFIWLGSGLIISSVDRFSRKLHLSSFAVSFFILGLLTSTPEFAVGVTSLVEKKPEIFVGNLIGGIPALFLFVIPVLAILGNGITLKNDFDKKTFIFSLFVIFAPTLFLINLKLTFLKGIILILLYLILLVIVQKNRGFLDNGNKELFHIKAYSYKDILKIIIGMAIVFGSSQIIVDKTLFFADILKISPFYISLIALSLGTNLPELFLAIRSVVLGRKTIAFANYLGSAASNTFLFGIFSILMKENVVVVVSNFYVTFIFIFLGLSLFYYFCKTKSNLSRTEGVALFLVYIAFIIYEFIK